MRLRGTRHVGRRAGESETENILDGETGKEKITGWT
jgi:hypothetical protein